MKTSVLLATLVTTCLISVQTSTTVPTPAVTTQATTHVTREHNEQAYLAFIYQPRTHHMIFKRNGHECYVATMSDAERQAIHTDSGIRAVEVRMIASLFTAVKVDPSTLHFKDVQTCSKYHNATSMVFYTM